MTSVYNSIQAYNLSRTERFLMSDECNSFRNFQHFRKRLLPFRQFNHLLANDLIADVASSFAYDSEDSEEGNQTTSNNKEAGKDVFSYKRRSAYFSNRHLIVKRKNQPMTVTCPVYLWQTSELYLVLLLRRISC